MATTHIFIVNENSFPIHLNYLFAGTGAGEKESHIGLLADIKRVRQDDYVIFYLERIGFFGIFQIEGNPFKDDSNPTYLENELKKKLIYRVKIKPYKVFPTFVSEWEALDKLPLYAQDVIWSLIYRKLKGQRGCTPINLQESERLIKMIENSNNGHYLILDKDESFTYNKGSNRIEIIKRKVQYSGGLGSTEDVLTEIADLDRKKRAFEDRLEVYFTENIGRNSKLEPICGKSEKIIWIGNEVFCGVGMQKIDIFTITSDERENKQFNVIELKSVAAYSDISYQLYRYVYWTESYIKGAINSNIQPILVTRKVINGFRKNGKPLKVKIERDKTIESLKDFNAKHISQGVKWFEFDFVTNDIIFEEIKYE
ncbi:MAG: EVE domain-containing protein [candidate division Zixibacteria bacterium]|nr:EVE domain-containing protein [candidate division Zixibacteria bacterium]